MYPYLLKMTVLLFVGGALSGQSLPTRFATIEVPKTLVHFGEIQEGEVAETTFLFFSKGDLPLEIFDLAPNCSCTKAESEALVLAPGKSGIIRVTVDTKGRPGNLEKLVAVVSNDPQNPQVTLTLRATVKNFHQPAGTEFKPENIFKEGCRSCHADRAQGKTGQALYQAVCRVCHQPGKSAAVHDSVWIRRQKTGEWTQTISTGSGRMPGFAVAHSGPLTSAQIDSLAVYLKEGKPPQKSR